MVGKETLLVMDKACLYNRWLYSFMDKYIGGDILEVGAGVGSFTHFLRKKGKLSVVDINNSYLKKLKKEFSDIHVSFGDIEKVKHFLKKKYDTVVCLNVLEHVSNDIKALRNMYRLLKKDGRLILLVPAHKSLYCKFDKKLGHFRRYDIDDIAKVLEAVGFGIIRKRYLNWFGALGWFIFMKIGNAEEFPESKVLFFNKISGAFLFLEKIIKFPFGLSVLTISKKL